MFKTYRRRYCTRFWFFRCCIYINKLLFNMYKTHYTIILFAIGTISVSGKTLHRVSYYIITVNSKRVRINEESVECA